MNLVESWWWDAWVNPPPLEVIQPKDLSPHPPLHMAGCGARP